MIQINAFDYLKLPLITPCTQDITYLLSKNKKKKQQRNMNCLIATETESGSYTIYLYKIKTMHTLTHGSTFFSFEKN